MDPEETIVEIRCGGKAYVCKASALAKDQDSALFELYMSEVNRRKAEGVEAVDGAARVARVHVVDEAANRFLGAVLRFYEEDSLDAVPSEPEALQEFAQFARAIRAQSLLSALAKGAAAAAAGPAPAQGARADSGGPGGGDDASQQASESARPALSSKQRSVSEATDRTALTDSSDLEDEERIFNQLMNKINERKTGDVGPDANLQDHGAVPGAAEIGHYETGELVCHAAAGPPPAPASAQDGADLEREIARLQAQIEKMESGDEADVGSLRERELLKVDLQRLLYERDQSVLVQRHAGKKLAYNLLVVGVTGTGKSSSLNTLLDQQVCKVSGAQAQGTRGCNMQDGFISDESFVSFIDTQGLGADTSVTDTELLSQIMMSTESISRMRIINNVLISFDTNTRATPATMANQLTLMELFGELRQSCFLILTKWNTNAVQCEWNAPLRRWNKRWRRAASIEEITEDPPSYQEMYEAYCDYIMRAMNNDEDAGAFSKMGTFLSFFEGRLLFMFNLDAVELEDLEVGELDPHILRMYHFYRDQALQCLRNGSTAVPVDNLTFLREDGDTLALAAQRLVAARDQKIDQLEKIGYDVNKRRLMGDVFQRMAKETSAKIGNADYDLVAGGETHLDQIATLAGFSSETPSIGCSVM